VEAVAGGRSGPERTDHGLGHAEEGEARETDLSSDALPGGPRATTRSMIRALEAFGDEFPLGFGPEEASEQVGALGAPAGPLASSTTPNVGSRRVAGSADP
jgi:hypothetical protein